MPVWVLLAFRTSAFRAATLFMRLVGITSRATTPERLYNGLTSAKRSCSCQGCRSSLNVASYPSLEDQEQKAINQQGLLSATPGPSRSCGVTRCVHRDSPLVLPACRYQALSLPTALANVRSGAGLIGRQNRSTGPSARRCKKEEDSLTQETLARENFTTIFLFDQHPRYGGR